MAGSLKACAFCGRTGVKLTGEHAFPRWLSRALDTRARGGVMYSSDTADLRQAPELDIKVREVCESCNGGWLHDLEAAFRSVMLDPIRGFPLDEPLPIKVQTVLAVWALKTWVLITHGSASYAEDDPGFGIQSGILRYLRERNEPPPTTKAWIGAVDAAQTSLVARFGRSPVTLRTTRQLVGIIGMFSIGCVIFQVYMPAKWERVPAPKHLLNVRLADVLVPYLTQIWPHQFAEVGWPPMGVLPVEYLRRIWSSSGGAMLIDAPPEPP